MGDEKITRTVKSAEHSRAKFLREALQHGAATLSLQDGASSLGTKELDSAFADDDPEVQRAYLEQLVECTPEAISILDTGYRITRLNREFTSIFDFRPEEAVGRR